LKSTSLSKEEVIAELIRRGELSWKLRPEQLHVLSLLYSCEGLAVFNISRRWGKSTTCALYCVENAIKQKQNIRFATAFLTDLESFICPIFEWVLQECPEHLRPTWMASKKEYRFPNGSVIKLVGLDKNPNGLRGNAIDILIVDECAYVSNLEYLYKSIIIPATAKRKFKLIFPSTPPESPEHFWSKELIPKAKTKGSYVELTIDDISDLPPEERKRLLDEVGGEHSPTAQREFFCKIIVDSTRAIAPSFVKSTHVQDTTPDHIKWMLFGDIGGIRDKTVFLRAGWCHNTQQVVFDDELVFEPNTTTSTIVNGVKEKWGTTTLVLDAPGQLLLDFSAQGLPASLPQKDEFSAGLLLLNNHLHNNQLTIHPRCTLLINTLESGLLTSKRTDYERTDTFGHADAVAAAIYALRGVDRLTDLRPKPSRQNMWIIETPDKITSSLQKLAY
jgi:hypothetical protein